MYSYCWINRVCEILCSSKTTMYKYMKRKKVRWKQKNICNSRSSLFIYLFVYSHHILFILSRMCCFAKMEIIRSFKATVRTPLWLYNICRKKTRFLDGMMMVVYWKDLTYTLNTQGQEQKHWILVSGFKFETLILLYTWIIDRFN